MDDLNILLKATLDKATSIQNINRDILKIQEGLKNVNIALNLGDFKAELEKVFGQLETQIAKTKKTKVQLGGIDDALRQVDDLNGSLKNIFTQVKELGNVKSLKNIYDNDGGLKGFAIQIENVKNGLKEVANYNIMGQFNKETKEYEYGLQKVSSKITEVVNKSKKITVAKVSQKDKNLLDYYKNATGYLLKVGKGAMDATTALKSLNKVMTKKDGSFASQFENLSEKQQMAILRQRKALENEVLRVAKEQHDVEQAILKAKDSQNAKMIKHGTVLKELNSKLNDIKTKYGSSVDTSQLKQAELQLLKLSQLDPNKNMKTYQATIGQVRSSITMLSRDSARSFKIMQDSLSDTTAKSSALGLSFRTIGQLFMIGSPIFLARTAFISIKNAVVDVDTAMINLKRVTKETEETYKQFTKTAYEMGNRLGANAKDIIESVTSFSKLGYEFAEAQKLAEDATKYAAAGWLDIEDATSSLTAAYSVFKNEVSSSTEIIDLWNHIGNTMAITSGGIGEAMKQTANALSVANNSIQESTTLIATANRTMNDPARVGNALKTISMRLRGINEETGELIPKLRETVRSLTNGMVDIWDDQEDRFKSTYQIITEISNVWEDMSDKQRAALMEVTSGKRQSEVFASLMGNAEDLTRGMELAKESVGSVDKEMAILMDTYERKVEQLANTWSKLANNSLNSGFVKGVIDGTRAVLEFTDACGGLNTVLIALTASFLVFKFAPMMGLKSLVETVGLLTLKVTGLAMSMTALKTILMTSGIGLVVAGIAAMGYAMNEASKRTEKLKDKIAELNTEISGARNDNKTAVALAKQYESLKELSKHQELTNEQQEEYANIQNQLKDLIPTVSGYIDERGDFLITEADMLEKVNSYYREYVDNKKQERAEASEKLVSSRVKDIEREVERVKELNSQIENIKSGKLAENKYGGEMWHPDSKYAQDIVRELENELGKSLTEMSKKTREFQGDILNMVYVTEEWESATKDQQDRIIELIRSMDGVGLSSFSKDVGGNTKELVNIFDEFADTIEKVNSKSASRGEVHRFEEACKSLGISAKTVMDIVNKLDDEIGETSKESVKNLSDIKQAIEDLSSAFDELSKHGKDLNSILEDLENGNGLTAESYSKILSVAPDLLQFIGDEIELKEQLIRKIKETEEQQTQYLNYMRVLQSENFGKMEERVATYYNNLGVGYEHDFTQYKNMEEAKAGLTTDLINKLNQKWAEYFKTVAKRIGVEQATMSDLQGRYSSYLTDGERERLGSLSKELGQARNEMEKIFSDHAYKFDKITLDTGRKSSSGKNSEIEDEFKKRIEGVKKGREEVERQIAELQEAIKLDDLIGIKDESKLNKMTLLLDKLRGLNEVELKGFEGLSDIYKKNEQLAELEKLIHDARKQGYIDEQQYIQHTIDLIERKASAEQRMHNDKIKQIEMQQFIAGDGTDEHLNLEYEKHNEIVSMQESLQDKIKSLKELGLSNEQDMVRKHIDAWADYEMARLGILKRMADKERERKLKEANETIQNLEKQKDAYKKLHDMVVDMMRKEREEKKKAIQEEIKGYEEIINIKKKALRDENDKIDTEKELQQKTKAVVDLENKLLMLDGVDGADAKARRLKLEEELIKAKEDLDKFNRQNILKNQEDMLDEELKNFKDGKEEEIKVIDDFLNHQGKIRDEATKRMDRDNKLLYEKLKQYSYEYTNVAGEEFQELWDTANAAVDGQIDRNLSLLDTLSLITDELEKQKNIRNDIEGSSWQSHSPPTSSGVGATTNREIETIVKMMENSSRWKSASDEEKIALANKNKELGGSIGAHYDQTTGTWYTDETKRRKLYNSIGVFHTGLKKGQIGTGLKANETIIKATKDEWVFTDRQMKNLSANLNNLINGEKQGVYSINLSIDKMLDIDKFDSNTDVENIVDRSVKQTMKTLNTYFRNMGLKPC